MQKILTRMAMATLVASMSSPFVHAAKPTSDTEKVFVMTNDAKKNEVLAYSRKKNGRFQSLGRFETGGRGSGGVSDPLEAQGPLSLSPDHTLLFAVNAGSGTVSSFAVSDNSLTLVDQQPTGGSGPVAVTQSGKFLYVVNQGAAGAVVAFRVAEDGHLKEISRSVTFLSGTGAGGASVAVSPDGQHLVVVERITNIIDTFRIFPDGTLSTIVEDTSKNPGAFSGIFSPAGQLFVNETGPAGVADGSTVSSYNINPDGSLAAISSAVPTYGSGNCWSALTPDGKRLYISNSASDNIAGFNVAPNGALTPIGSGIVGANPTGSHNVDIAISGDGTLVYTQNTGSGTIGVFSVQSNGTLVEEEGISGLPKDVGFNGLAAF